MHTLLTEIEPNDDIFARPPRAVARATAAAAPVIPSAMVGRTACAVCGLRTDVLICRECAEQPQASRARVLAWLDANTTQARALLATWDAIREPQQPAWDKIQAAHDQPNFAQRCAKHRADGTIYGKLLDAEAAYYAALQPLDIERTRLENALEVIATL